MKKVQFVVEIEIDDSHESVRQVIGLLDKNMREGDYSWDMHVVEIITHDNQEHHHSFSPLS